MIKKHMLTILTLLITSVIILTAIGISINLLINGKENEKVVYKLSTKIANVELMNKSREDIQLLLIDSINNWKSQSTVKFFLKEEELTFSINELIFLLDESIAITKEGNQTGLITNLKFNNLQEDVSRLTGENIKWETIVNEIISPAMYLIPINKNFCLEDYFTIEEKEVVLAQSIINLSSKDDSSLLNIIIPLERGNFSLNEWLLSNKVVFNHTATYTELASAIYEVICLSNMEITERYISTKLPSNILIGNESYIDMNQNLDLKFYNPNNQKMKISIEAVEKQLTVQLIGKPFLYKYTVEKISLQPMDYTVNNRISKKLRNNTSIKKLTGIKGQVIELQRLKVHPITHEVVGTTTVIDTYSPVPEMWVNGLIDLSIENNE